MKIWTLQAIGQLSEEDITFCPTTESNSIANLVAHISGEVHSRIETILYNIPDTRDRDKEFTRGLEMSKEQAMSKVNTAFDILIQYLEHLKSIFIQDRSFCRDMKLSGTLTEQSFRK
ncbi:hypothetical protein AWJ19_05880 [Paenibacillus sp. DMB5]|nr:hypothetical protein AWJ19_05880 [Paenibacillus sp. DMB5]